MSNNATRRRQVGRMEWTTKQTTELLNLISNNDGWRFSLFGKGYKTSHKYEATRQLCLVMFAKDRGWLQTMIGAGLIADEEGVWRATEAWMTSAKDTVQMRLERLKVVLDDKAIKDKFQVNPAKWRCWEDVPEKQRQSIKKAYPYYFVYRDLITKKALYASIPEWKTVAAPAHAEDSQRRARETKRRREPSTDSDVNGGEDDIDDDETDDGDDADFEGATEPSIAGATATEVGPPLTEVDLPRAVEDEDEKPRDGLPSSPVEVVCSSAEVKMETTKSGVDTYEPHTSLHVGNPLPPAKRRRTDPISKLRDVAFNDVKPSFSDVGNEHPARHSPAPSDQGSSSSSESESDGSSHFDFGDVSRRVGTSNPGTIVTFRSVGWKRAPITSAPAGTSSTSTTRALSAPAKQLKGNEIGKTIPPSAVKPSSLSALMDLLVRDEFLQWSRVVLDQPVAPGSLEELLARARLSVPPSYAMGPAIVQALSKRKLRNPNVASKVTNLRDYVAAFKKLARHEDSSQLLRSYRVLVEDKQTPSTLRWIKDLRQGLIDMGAEICHTEDALHQPGRVIRVLVRTDAPTHPLHIVRWPGYEEVWYMASALAMCRFIDQVNQARRAMACMTAIEQATAQIQAARRRSFDPRSKSVLLGHEWFSLVFHPPHYNPKRAWAYARLRLLIDGYEMLAGGASHQLRLKDFRFWFHYDAVGVVAQSNNLECPDAFPRAVNLLRLSGAQVVERRDDLDEPTTRPVTLIVNRYIGLEADPTHQADATYPTENLLGVLLRLDRLYRRA